VCSITAFLPPGDQTMKYKFSPGAKYGNKKPGKYRKKEIKKYVGSGVKSGSAGHGQQYILFMVPYEITIVPFETRDSGQNSDDALDCKWRPHIEHVYILSCLS